MPVSNISDVYTDSWTTSARDAGKEDPLGRDAFLKMLVAQMEHQDPLNPMDGTEYSAQLAQFSSLEQLFQVNKTLEALSTSMEPSENENVLDYIGKQVLSKDDTIRLKEGDTTGGSFTLEQAREVRISIYDDGGREVITLYPGKLDAGTHAVAWNGFDRTASPAPDGNYRFELTAVSDRGIEEPIEPATSGAVSGVSYSAGKPYLEVDGRLVDPATVIKVWLAG